VIFPSEKFARGQISPPPIFSADVSVAVAVAVSVGIAVFVGVRVGVAVLVAVAVAVLVGVAVLVEVGLGSAVGSTGAGFEQALRTSKKINKTRLTFFMISSFSLIIRIVHQFA
jgi:hypothetical protein